jgi:pyruvate,orthophosphate dikinase
MPADTPAIHSIGDFAQGAAMDAATIGFKAYNLARMARLGLSVPEAYVMTTDWCRAWLAEPQATREHLHASLRTSLQGLERATGFVFGGARKPLLVSVRSGAAVSMPGMMDTLLNIGLCDATVGGLLRLTGNPRLVWDSYRRLVMQYAEVVMQADGTPFRELTQQAVAAAPAARVQELDFSSLKALTHTFLERFHDVTGQRFPQDPFEQLEGAVGAVLDSWSSSRAVAYRKLNGIDANLGTAVTVQRMVFGNAGGTSGSGVGFTRDPATGENRPYIDFLFNSQGEDVVSGRHASSDTGRLEAVLPRVAGELDKVRIALEREFADAQEFEFTVQDGRLFLLQTRTAKRTPWAALRMAVDQVREGLISPAVALGRLAGIDLRRLERRRLAASANAAVIGEAVSAGSGVACGPIALDAAAAQRYADSGKPAVLVRENANTEDIGGIATAVGLLTARGSRTAHAAVVARQLGCVCLVGCAPLRIDSTLHTISLGGLTLAEGDTICLDADSARVFAGAPELVVEKPTEWLREVDRWRVEADKAPHCSDC